MPDQKDISAFGIILIGLIIVISVISGLGLGDGLRSMKIGKYTLLLMEVSSSLWFNLGVKRIAFDLLGYIESLLLEYQRNMRLI